MAARPMSKRMEQAMARARAAQAESATKGAFGGAAPDAQSAVEEIKARRRRSAEASAEARDASNRKRRQAQLVAFMEDAELRKSNFTGPGSGAGGAAAYEDVYSGDEIDKYIRLGLLTRPKAAGAGGQGAPALDSPNTGSVYKAALDRTSDLTLERPIGEEAEALGALYSSSKYEEGRNPVSDMTAGVEEARDKLKAAEIGLPYPAGNERAKLLERQRARVDTSPSQAQVDYVGEMAKAEERLRQAQRMAEPDAGEMGPVDSADALGAATRLQALRAKGERLFPGGTSMSPEAQERIALLDERISNAGDQADMDAARKYNADRKMHDELAALPKTAERSSRMAQLEAEMEQYIQYGADAGGYRARKATNDEFAAQLEAARPKTKNGYSAEYERLLAQARDDPQIKADFDAVRNWSSDGNKTARAQLAEGLRLSDEQAKLRRAADRDQAVRLGRREAGLIVNKNVKVSRGLERDATDRILNGATGVYASVLGDTIFGNAKEKLLKYDYMSDDEKSDFYYYLGIGQQDKAFDYLESLEGRLEDRVKAAEQGELRELAEERPAVGAAGQFISNFGSPAAVIPQAYGAAKNAIKGDAFYEPAATAGPLNRAAYSAQALGEGVEARITRGLDDTKPVLLGMTQADLARQGYGLVQSIASSAVNVAAFGPASVYVMGAQAAGGATYAAAERGLSPAQALAIGVGSGLIEGLTEKYSVENFLKFFEGGSKMGLKLALKEVGKQMLAEGSEEIAAELLDNALDILVAGDMSEFAQYKNQLVAGGMGEEEASSAAIKQFFVNNVLSSGIGGTISGVAFGTVGVGKNNYNVAKNNRIEARAAKAQQQSGDTGNRAALETVAKLRAQEAALEQEWQRQGAADRAPADTARVVQEYEAAVDPDILGFAEAVAKGGRDGGDRVGVGAVDAAHADVLQRLTGTDYTGFKIELTADALRHINSRHGANGAADHSMADANDIARMRYVIENFDGAQIAGNTGALRNSDGSRADVILLEKRIDGHYYVAEAVPDAPKKTIYVQSAYRNRSLASGEWTNALPPNVQNAVANAPVSDGGDLAGESWKTPSSYAQNGPAPVPAIGNNVPQPDMDVNAPGNALGEWEVTAEDAEELFDDYGLAAHERPDAQRAADIINRLQLGGDSALTAADWDLLADYDGFSQIAAEYSDGGAGGVDAGQAAQQQAQQAQQAPAQMQTADFAENPQNQTQPQQQQPAAETPA
ncbi:MAG: hypothetical protein LBL83_12380, partial [Clostridiales bacterium]|nr:hypothetical protein [Clostridiales bacterium]